MKLEDQVCSLESAKKLKELGVRQESYFVWIGDDKRAYVTEKAWIGCARCGAVKNGLKPPRTVPEFSAFTVAELGEMLRSRGFSVQHSWKEVGKWHCYYRHLESGEVIVERKGIKFEAKTEADARAKMLIYLNENNLL